MPLLDMFDDDQPEQVDLELEFRCLDCDELRPSTYNNEDGLVQVHCNECDAVSEIYIGAGHAEV